MPKPIESLQPLDCLVITAGSNGGFSVKVLPRKWHPSCEAELTAGFTNAQDLIDWLGASLLAKPVDPSANGEGS